jgi:hypothetical protein
MAKEEWSKLPVEELKKKEKGIKGLLLVFVPIIIGLFYAVIRNYWAGEETDWSILTIAICSLAGPATLYPQLKEVREEIKSRG